MNREPFDEEMDRALDAALARILTAPDLPAQFRARLQLALTRPGEAGAAGEDGLTLEQLRQRLEADQRQALTQLQDGYLRLRRRTLGALIAAAFATGAAAAGAMPWLVSHIGPSAPLLVASIGTALGLAVAFGTWFVRPGVPMAFTSRPLSGGGHS